MQCSHKVFNMLILTTIPTNVYWNTWKYCLPHWSGWCICNIKHKKTLTNPTILTFVVTVILTYFVVGIKPPHFVQIPAGAIMIGGQGAHVCRQGKCYQGCMLFPYYNSWLYTLSSMQKFINSKAWVKGIYLQKEDPF